MKSFYRNKESGNICVNKCCIFIFSYIFYRSKRRVMSLREKVVKSRRRLRHWSRSRIFWLSWWDLLHCICSTVSDINWFMLFKPCLWAFDNLFCLTFSRVSRYIDTTYFNNITANYLFGFKLKLLIHLCCWLYYNKRKDCE